MTRYKVVYYLDGYVRDFKIFDSKDDAEKFIDEHIESRHLDGHSFDFYDWEAQFVPDTETLEKVAKAIENYIETAHYSQYNNKLYNVLTHDTRIGTARVIYRQTGGHYEKCDFGTYENVKTNDPRLFKWHEATAEIEKYFEHFYGKGNYEIFDISLTR